VLLQAGPRVALLGLLRAEYRQPFVHWMLGAVGADLMVGFRPVKPLSVQFRYQPMLFQADLQGKSRPDEPAPIELLHRIVGTVEIGF